jgi:hypothetical protein
VVISHKRAVSQLTSYGFESINETPEKLEDFIDMNQTLNNDSNHNLDEQGHP